MELANLVEVSVQFIKSHPEFACFFLFLWTFLETGLLIGLFLPAEKILILAAVLVSKGIISPWSFLFCGILGTFLGYTATYFVGHYFGEEKLEKNLGRFKLSKKEILQTKEFIKTKGKLAILLGRFIPVVRAVLPLLIGTFRIPLKEFSFYNLLGAILWVSSYILIGNLIEKTLSIIIRHKLFGIVLFAILFLLYLVWRKYGKNKKLF